MKWRWIIGSLAILGIGFLLFLALAGTGTSRRPDKAVRTQALIAALDAAFERYRVDHGFYPSGTNAEITAAVQGTYIGLHPDQVNKQGELLDGWGRPFHFACFPGKRPIAISAGHDGVFDSPDDIGIGTGP